MKQLIVMAILGAAIAAPAAAGDPQDDLQAVKKAVLASSESPASASRTRPPAEDPGPRAAEARPRSRAQDGPMWFRVRIVEKAGKRARLSLNLPIGLVRSFDDDWPIPGQRGCRVRDRCRATIGEILRALDSGQSIVDIEDDEATVRVWVE